MPTPLGGAPPRATHAFERGAALPNTACAALAPDTWCHYHRVHLPSAGLLARRPPPVFGALRLLCLGRAPRAPLVAASTRQRRACTHAGRRRPPAWGPPCAPACAACVGPLATNTWQACKHAGPSPIAPRWGFSELLLTTRRPMHAHPPWGRATPRSPRVQGAALPSTACAAALVPGVPIPTFTTRRARATRCGRRCASARAIGRIQRVHRLRWRTQATAAHMHINGTCEAPAPTAPAKGSARPCCPWASVCSAPTAANCKASTVSPLGATRAASKRLPQNRCRRALGAARPGACPRGLPGPHPPRRAREPRRLCHTGSRAPCCINLLAHTRVCACGA